VVWTFSGVRPLYDDGASLAQEATRDYVLRLEADDGEAPLLSVFGGKITTYRRLAEAALDALSARCADFSQDAGWTAHACLPGGDFPATGFDDLVDAMAEEHPRFERGFLERLCRLYGTRARSILGGADTMADLGRHFGGTLTAREVDHLMREEWAQTAEDVLWRRTKLGLVLSDAERAAVAEAMSATDDVSAAGSARA
jgi:glycerol-3-phosphate dehydrogenase